MLLIYLKKKVAVVAVMNYSGRWYDAGGCSPSVEHLGGPDGNALHLEMALVVLGAIRLPEVDPREGSQGDSVPAVTSAARRFRVMDSGTQNQPRMV